MVHKFNLKDVEVKAILIVGQPTSDVKASLPNDVEQKVVKERDYYDDLDDTMKEFTDSMGGFDKKDRPLIAEGGVSNGS